MIRCFYALPRYVLRRLELQATGILHLEAINRKTPNRQSVQQSNETWCKFEGDDCKIYLKPHFANVAWICVEAISHAKPQLLITHNPSARSHSAKLGRQIKPAELSYSAIMMPYQCIALPYLAVGWRGMAASSTRRPAFAARSGSAPFDDDVIRPAGRIHGITRNGSVSAGTALGCISSGCRHVQERGVTEGGYGR